MEKNCVQCGCDTQQINKRYTLSAKVPYVNLNVRQSLIVFGRTCLPPNGYICSKCMYALSKELASESSDTVQPAADSQETLPQTQTDISTDGDNQETLPQTQTDISISRKKFKKRVKSILLPPKKKYTDKYVTKPSASTSTSKAYIPTVLMCLKAGHLRRGLNKLFTNSKKARKELAGIVAKVVRQEVKAFILNNAFPELNHNNLTSFSWDETLKSMSAQMPVLYHSLLAAITKKKTESVLDRSDDEESCLIPRLGFLMTVPLFTRNVCKFNFLQATLGVQLWKCGGNKHILHLMNGLGICMSYNSTRRNVNKLTKESEESQKNEIEEDDHGSVKKSKFSFFEEILKMTESDDEESDEDFVPNPDLVHKKGDDEGSTGSEEEDLCAEDQVPTKDTKENDKRKNFMGLEIPTEALQSCCLLQTGESLLLTGNSSKSDSSEDMELLIQVNKRTETTSWTIQALSPQIDLTKGAVYSVRLNENVTCTERGHNEKNKLSELRLPSELQGLASAHFGNPSKPLKTAALQLNPATAEDLGLISLNTFSDENDDVGPSTYSGMDDLMSGFNEEITSSLVNCGPTHNIVKTSAALSEETSKQSSLMVKKRKFSSVNPSIAAKSTKKSAKSKTKSRKTGKLGKSQSLNLTCMYCREVFKALTTRFEHESYECPQNPNRLVIFHCQECGKKFVDEDKLNSHQKAHVQGTDLFVCDICGKELKTKWGIKNHKRNEHDNSPPQYKCSKCNKVFKQRSHLKEHGQVHTEQRDWQCEVCGKAFKSKRDLHRHVQHVHHYNYNHHCSKCGQGFHSPKYLETHKCSKVHVQRRQPGLKTRNNNTHAKSAKKMANSTQEPLEKCSASDHSTVQQNSCSFLGTEELLDNIMHYNSQYTESSSKSCVVPTDSYSSVDHGEQGHQSECAKACTSIVFSDTPSAFGSGLDNNQTGISMGVISIDVETDDVIEAFTLTGRSEQIVQMTENLHESMESE